MKNKVILHILMDTHTHRQLKYKNLGQRLFLKIAVLGDRRGRREGTEQGRGPRILQLGRGGAGVPWDRGLPAAQAEARALRR